jgi:hypothetical protein
MHDFTLLTQPPPTREGLENQGGSQGSQTLILLIVMAIQWSAIKITILFICQRSKKDYQRIHYYKPPAIIEIV